MRRCTSRGRKRGVGWGRHQSLSSLNHRFCQLLTTKGFAHCAMSQVRGHTRSKFEVGRHSTHLLEKNPLLDYWHAMAGPAPSSRHRPPILRRQNNMVSKTSAGISHPQATLTHLRLVGGNGSVLHQGPTWRLSTTLGQMTRLHHTCHPIW